MGKNHGMSSIWELLNQSGTQELKKKCLCHFDELKTMI